MNIYLSRDLERIVHNAMRAGFYAHEDDVIRDALIRLQQTMPKPARAARKTAKRTSTPPQKPETPLTEAELQQHMLKIGLMSQLPDTAADFDDPEDVPITIKGEPLSETIIRERR